MILAGVPAPTSVGYELEDARGAVAAEAELVWENSRVAYLPDPQSERKARFEDAGWTVISDCSDLAEIDFERSK